MEHENHHYFTVGLFVLGIFLAICGFTIWLTHKDEGDYEHYLIRFAESVSGLSKGSLVKFRGVNVGTVDNIQIDKNDTRLIRVDISLLKTTPLKSDTKASLKTQGITGVVFVELLGGNPSLPDLVKNPDENQVAEIPAEPSSINQILDTVPILLTKFSKTLDQLNALVNDETIAHVHGTLANTDRATANLQSILSSSQKDIHQSTRDAAEAMRHLNNAAGRADNLSQSIESNPTSLLFPPKDKGIPAP